jgi:hypothetical protein
MWQHGMWEEANNTTAAHLQVTNIVPAAAAKVSEHEDLKLKKSLTRSQVASRSIYLTLNKRKLN